MTCHASSVSPDVSAYLILYSLGVFHHIGFLEYKLKNIGCVLLSRGTYILPKRLFTIYLPLDVARGN